VSLVVVSFEEDNFILMFKYVSAALGTRRQQGKFLKPMISYLLNSAVIVPLVLLH
jgi:hypothetical protein